MQRHCDECGTEYQAKRATSRFCSTRCRTRRTRNRDKGIDAPSRPLAVLTTSQPLTDATRSELTDAGLVDTADGILLLTLAARIDSVPETSPALASLAKEYAARKAETMSRGTVAASPFDELRALRERRRAQ